MLTIEFTMMKTSVRQVAVRFAEIESRSTGGLRAEAVDPP